MEAESNRQMEYTNDYVIKKEKLTDQSKIKIPKINTDSRIFHYTSTEGLKSILGNRTLWFTNIQYMNDAKELIDGIDVMMNLIFEQNEDMISYKKDIEGYIKQSVLERNVFVCCFSEGQDELPLWNYYTKNPSNQGYNLIFNYKKLVNSLILKNKEALEGSSLSIGKVVYRSEKKDSYIQRALKIFMSQFKEPMGQIYIAQFPTLYNQYKNKIEEPEEEVKALYIAAYDDIYKQFIDENETLPPIYLYNGEKQEFERTLMADLLILFKDKSFSSEKEVRIALIISDESLVKLKKEGAYKFRNSSGILIPYIELEYDIGAIEGITIAPTIKDDLAERSIREYCKYCGIDIKKRAFKINKSQIPVRF